MTDSDAARIKAYIFTSSPNPDPYVNAICGIESKYGPAAVSFIQLNDGGDMYPGDIISLVSNRLKEMSRGSYQRRDDTSADIPQEGRECYTRLLRALETFGEFRNVPLGQLDSQLSTLLASGRTVFDVTALRKDYLVDLVALLISRGVKDIGYFHLKKTETRDENDMFHSLNPNTFEYLDVSRSRNVRLASDRISRQSVAVRILFATFTILALAAIVLQYTGGNPVSDSIGAAGFLLGLVASVIQIREWFRR
jgi:hypothetical protein